MGWFSNKQNQGQTPDKIRRDDVRVDEIDAVREQTNKALKEFNEKFNELNKVLEERGDTAYNVFMATPASRNYRKKK